MGSLDGKVAIVTGAGRGIGQAITKKLAAAGAKVIANDLDPGPLTESVTQLETSGAEVHAHPGDITNPAMGDTLVDVASVTIWRPPYCGQQRRIHLELRRGSSQ